MEEQQLIGREGELAELDRLLEESAREGFRVLALGGEPGIGKTSLLGQLAAKGNEAGWLVLQGSAAEFETELPLGVVIDCLDAYLQALDPRSANRFDEDTLAELAGIFPGLSTFREADRGPALSSERFRSYHAIRKLVEDLGTRQNLLIVLDDCQWADQASLELVSHLLRRPPDAPVLVAAGYRSNRIHPVMEADLKAGAGRGLVTMIDVGPLDAEQSRELSGTTGQAESDRLFAETGGNPFYILELAKFGDGASPAPNSKVPPSVGAAISSEIALVSDSGRTYLEAAAVTGDPFDIDLAGAVSGLEHVEAIDALDELDRIGLVAATEIPRRFKFRHPLIRNAVYKSIKPGARLLLHEAAADSLRGSGVPAIEMASHVELAARPGDRESAEILISAAEVALPQAPAIALRWFGAARRVLPDAEAPLRMRNLGGLAAAAAAEGLHDMAIDALTECVGLLGDAEENAGSRTTLIAACAALERLKGAHDQSIDRLHRAFGDVEDPESLPAIELMMQLANSGIFRMDVDLMREWSVPALAAARKMEDDLELLAVAFSTRAVCAAFEGDMDTAIECRDEAAAVLAKLDDDLLARNIDALNRVSAAELYLELFPESIAHAEKGLEISRNTGQAQHFFLLYPCIGNATVVIGDLARSASLLDAAVESSRLARNSQGLVWALMGRANTALTTGDIEIAKAACEEADGIEMAQEDGLIGGWSGAVTGNTLFELGRYEEALEVLHRRCGGEELPGIPSTWRVRYLALQASILLKLGRPADAERLVALAEEQAGRFGRPLARSFASRARAEIAIEAGDAGTAIDAAGRAAGDANSAGAPIEAALCRLWLGRALGAAGRRDEALEELNGAAAVFGEFGTARYLKATEQEQRALGQRISRRTKGGQGETGIDALTEREREVAELVTDRHTNREIAETLFLSQKTVETHLRNIFTKLGVKSRVETARLIEKTR